MKVVADQDTPTTEEPPCPRRAPSRRRARRLPRESAAAIGHPRRTVPDSRRGCGVCWLLSRKRFVAPTWPGNWTCCGSARACQDSAVRADRMARARRQDDGSLKERFDMAVRKQCKAKGCKASPRCEHPWWFDVMHQGKRYRMPVDAFALVRGATQPVSSKQEAEKVWEPKFIGEIVAGKDPRKPPAPPASAGHDGRRLPRSVLTSATSSPNLCEVSPRFAVALPR